MSPASHKPDLSRRQALIGIMAAGGLAGLPKAALSQTMADDWQQSFEAALKKNPSLAPFESAPLAGYGPTDISITGTWPEAAHGVLYRNGPGLHSFGGERYQHLFDGDGMIQRYEVSDKGVRHSGRFVRTTKFEREMAAGKRTESTFATTRRPASNPDELNVANTSILLLPHRLLALWEGGSAYELHPDDLSTVGPVTWSPETAGLPFSAHPHHDADGSLWNIGIAPYSGKMVVYHLSAKGDLLHAEALALPQLSMVHDFVVTPKHLVIVLPSYVYDPERRAKGLSFLDCHVWRPDLSSKVMIVPKDDLTHPKIAELPAGFVFHYGNGWEEADGSLHLDCCWYDTAGIVDDAFRRIMRGDVRKHSLSHLAKIEIAASHASAKLEILPIGAEFPQINHRLDTLRHRYVYGVGIPPSAQGITATSQLIRYDHRKDRLDAYTYGAGIIAQEPLFIAKPGTPHEGSGWLVATSLDTQRKRTSLSLFDAEHVAQGPIAVATLPYLTPYGFHGQFRAL